jgi:hypothetical protein
VEPSRGVRDLTVCVFLTSVARKTKA